MAEAAPQPRNAVDNPARIKVPADMGIIGFNDMAIAAWPAYNLTTLHQPTADIITAAVELMLSIIEKPVKKPVVRLFDCRVVVRGTLKAA